MNETTPVAVPMDIKEYVVSIDPDGNEVRTEVRADGTYAQDAEDEGTAEPKPTVH